MPGRPADLRGAHAPRGGPYVVRECLVAAALWVFAALVLWVALDLAIRYVGLLPRIGVVAVGGGIPAAVACGLAPGLYVWRELRRKRARAARHLRGELKT